ncbi:MATE family efflux transporter [Blautia sp. Marseille-P3201T]|uniref:MATE family efflux transporter n=1 Tax=Blautia sp. Marseille-P3201T TaxID=1907659 RepID=UPI000931F81E|nr:MATE family efflux transporter [Blautia sp. Marseille-P3201T]
MGKNFTTGSVLKGILFFSLPYLLSYFLQTLYGMADLFIIGQFADVSATTAVSIGSQVMHLLTVMIVGLAMGSTVSIGQAVGRNDKKSVSENIGNTVALFMIISLILTAVLLIFVNPVVSIMSTPPEAVSGTVDYLTICFIGIPFITAYNIISSIFRGMGDSKTPMYFIAVACIINIGLDYLFMGVFQMGPSGAALGTVLSQACSVLISLIIIFKRKNEMAVKKEDFKPNRIVMKKILNVGIPIALQDGFIQISFLIITIIANSRGLNDAAAVGIVEKIISFLFLVPFSMLSTVSALGAQNIGAGKQERAKQTLRYATIITVCFGLIVAIVMQFFAEPVVALFTDEATSDGAKTILLGEQYLRGYVWDCMFAGIHFSFSGYFCACGKSMLSFIHNILAILLVRVPGVYLTSLLFPETLFPMGLATAAGSLLSAVVCVIFFKTILNRNTPVALKN